MLEEINVEKYMKLSRERYLQAWNEIANELDYDWRYGPEQAI